MDDLVDDAAIVAPLRPELLIEPVFVRIVANALVSLLRPADEEVELLHFLVRRGPLRRRLREQIAALGGAKIGRKVVEVPEQPGIGQPAVADVGGNPIEIAQAFDAEQPEHQHEQEKEEKYRGQAEADRSQLLHGGASQSPYQFGRGADRNAGTAARSAVWNR